MPRFSPERKSSCNPHSHPPYTLMSQILPSPHAPLLQSRRPTQDSLVAQTVKNLPAVWEVSEVAQFCPILCNPMDCNLPGSSVQEISPTQGLNTGLLNCSQTLYRLSCQGSQNPGSILGSGRSLGEGNGNPLQYSCLENPMDRGAWWGTVHGVAKE